MSREAGALVVLSLARTAVDYLSHAKSTTALTDIVTDLSGALLRALGVAADEALEIARASTNLLIPLETGP